MKKILIPTILALMATILLGCRGLGSQEPVEQGTIMKVYELNFASDAKSVVNIGNGASQSPMYQGPEGIVEASTQGDYPGDPTEGTGGAQEHSASGGTNALTARGKYNIAGQNDNFKRIAETDVASALELAAGLSQSAAGLTAPVAQREGTATGTGTIESTPRIEDTRNVQPIVPITGEGPASGTGSSVVSGGEGNQPNQGGGTTDGSQTVTITPKEGHPALHKVTMPDGSVVDVICVGDECTLPEVDEDGNPITP